jgi:excisionase family DNA binding protein
MADFLTAQQVAELLQLHILTVYRLAESGELPAFKAGRQWRFAREAIEEWARKGQARRGQAVLVVDDELPVLRLFERMLRPTGAEVVTLESGEEAVQLCRERDFDVVFLDLQLPGANGVEVMKELKEIGSRARIVVITGYPGHPLVAEAVKLDPVMVLYKPFTPEQAVKAMGPLPPGRS